MIENPILAVDPGKMTGWALMQPDGTVTFGQDPFGDFLVRMDRWGEKLARAGILGEFVVERFTIMKSTAEKSRTDVNWSIETIGVARLHYFKNRHRLTLQGASDGKRFGTDTKLKAMGWWTAGADHAQDAGRHLCLYLAQHHQPVFERLYPGPDTVTDPK